VNGQIRGTAFGHRGRMPKERAWASRGGKVLL
jgi:hypothetical protein